MLVRLEIRDFAVISNIVFEPGFGLNVISGETGAGKSLIVDAIGLILGAKASRNLIRTGSPSAFAEAVFDCSDIDDEEFKKILEDNGAIRAFMTGSGPTVFAVYDDEEEARKGYNAVKESGLAPELFLSRPVNPGK